MSNSSPWRPEPKPQNALERLIAGALHDPGRHGELFRKLWESDLHIYIPAHPEMEGLHSRNTDDGFTWSTYRDAKGEFAAVFTSEAIADYHLAKLPPPAPMLATMPAEVLFRFLNTGETTVLVSSAGGGELRLNPDAVAALVAGELTHHHGTAPGTERPMTVTPVPDEEVPMRLRQAIRVFCAKRRVPIGVYVFRSMDRETGEYPANTLTIILWLRETDNDYYNDFSLMVGRVKPLTLEIDCGVMTPDDVSEVALLQTCTPLWPVMPSTPYRRVGEMGRSLLLFRVSIRD